MIGAGLSGLATAFLLTQAGEEVRVLEARGSPGGRIRSVHGADGAFLGDLGPTWIWPVVQPVVSRWVKTLGVETFPQYREGALVFDRGPEHGPQIVTVPSPTDEVRVVGGPQAFIDQLVAGLPRDAVLTDRAVTAISTVGKRIDVTTSAGETLRCERVIVAVPPRVARRSIDWTPALPAALEHAMRETPTWMAPHAKVLAVYDECFWRARGLSGRIASQSGPIVEGHDHCGAQGTPAALFGFIGWPHEARAELGAQLEEQVAAQLKRCFGPDSPEPVAIHIEEWAGDPRVASPQDLAGPMDHPEVRPDVLRQPHADGRLFFAGAETALRSPGLIEGAFDAAERVAKDVLK